MIHRPCPNDAMLVPQVAEVFDVGIPVRLILSLFPSPGRFVCIALTA